MPLPAGNNPSPVDPNQPSVSPLGGSLKELTKRLAACNTQACSMLELLELD
jgi:hypothetical protein